MGFPFRKFWVLVRITITELVRQPICGLLIAGASILIMVAPLTVAHQFGPQTSMARDGSMAFQFVFGLLLAAYAACSTLHAEMNSNTVIAVLSKPVSRDVFFAAKFAGVSAVLLLFALCASAATLLADRFAPRFFEYDAFGLKTVAAALAAALGVATAADIFKRRRFVTVFLGALPLALCASVGFLSFFDRTGATAPFGSSMNWSLIPASATITLALFVLAALGLSLATRLGAAPTAAILAATLFLGLISGYVLDRLPGGGVIRFPLRCLLPDFQSFWTADDLTAQAVLSTGAVLRSVLYAALYAGGVLCLGAAAFRNRQF